MTRLPMDRRYSGVAITFHWVIALLVIVNMTIGFLHDPVPALGAWMPTHKSIGITVLVLTLGRVAWRRPPPLPAETKAWERGAAHATHWTLYALLLAMPLTGWLMVSGTEKRRPLDWFGLFDIPYLPVSKAAGGFGGDAHGLLGWLMLALVVLILRDSVLLRMVPGGAR